MTAHLKLLVCDGSIDYYELRDLLTTIQSKTLFKKITFVDNGNIVLERSDTV